MDKRFTVRLPEAKGGISLKSTAIHLGSILYLTSAAVIFCLCWLRAGLNAAAAALLLIFAGRLFFDYKEETEDFVIDKKYFFMVLAIASVWCFFSGIGGFSFQNGDYYVRNPIYRDLCNEKWPVIYNLSGQSDLVKKLTGGGNVAFVYYFAFWLPPAALSKLVGAGELLANIFLLLWAILGVVLVMLEITIYLKKCTCMIPAVFIFFSGLDIVPYVLKNLIAGSLSIAGLLGSQKEWWAEYFQYSSNTTLLYWVFNQAIPVWLIIGCLINMRRSRHSFALTSLTFIYSPFATFGMIPIAIYSAFKNGRDKWKECMNVINIAIPGLILLIWGSFYLSNSGSISKNGFIWQLTDDRLELIGYYVLFILFEVGIYFWILRKKIRKYDYLLIALAELLLFPIYKMTPANDFVMRGSIPALCILSVSCIRFLCEEKSALRNLLIVFLLVGSLTSISEINRSLYYTAKGEIDNEESVYSFADIRSTSKREIRRSNRQFFAHDYEETFFFRYLGKQGGSE